MDWQAIVDAAGRLGVDPVVLGGIIHRETAGSMSPDQWGGTGGRYLGLIQFSPENQAQYGVRPGMGFRSQLMGPVVSYIQDRFKRADMDPGQASPAQLYASILAGSPTLTGAADVNGNSRDAVASIMQRGHALARRYGAPRPLEPISTAGVPMMGMAAATAPPPQVSARVSELPPSLPPIFGMVPGFRDGGRPPMPSQSLDALTNSLTPLRWYDHLGFAAAQHLTLPMMQGLRRLAEIPFPGDLPNGPTSNPLGYRVLPGMQFPPTAPLQHVGHMAGEFQADPRFTYTPGGRLSDNVEDRRNDPPVTQALRPTYDPTDRSFGYRDGGRVLNGLKILIEYEKGSVRSGKGADGKIWKSPPLACAYGEIQGHRAADGERVDCYVGDDKGSRKVWVVDQVNAETGKYDEAKAMLAFPSKNAALAAYEKAFSDGKGRQRIGAVKEFSVEEFRQWLHDGGAKKPVPRYANGGHVPPLPGNKASSPRDQAIAAAMGVVRSRANGGRVGYADGGEPLVPGGLPPLPSTMTMPVPIETLTGQEDLWARQDIPEMTRNPGDYTQAMGLALADPFGLPSALTGLVSPDARDAWRARYEGRPEAQDAAMALTPMGPLFRGAQMGLNAIPRALTSLPPLAQMGLAGVGAATLLPSEASPQTQSVDPTSTQGLGAQRAAAVQRRAELEGRLRAARSRAENELRTGRGPRHDDAAREVTNLENEVKGIGAEISGIDVALADARRRSDPTFQLDMDRKREAEATRRREEWANTPLARAYPWAPPALAAAGIGVGGLLGNAIARSGVNRYNTRISSLSDDWAQAIERARNARLSGPNQQLALDEAAAVGQQFNALEQRGARGHWPAVLTTVGGAEVGFGAPTLVDYVSSQPGSQLRRDTFADPSDIFLRMGLGAATGFGLGEGISNFARRRIAEPRNLSGVTSALENRAASASTPLSPMPGLLVEPPAPGQLRLPAPPSALPGLPPAAQAGRPPLVENMRASREAAGPPPATAVAPNPPASYHHSQDQRRRPDGRFGSMRRNQPRKPQTDADVEGQPDHDPNSRLLRGRKKGGVVNAALDLARRYMSGGRVQGYADGGEPSRVGMFSPPKDQARLSPASGGDLSAMPMPPMPRAMVFDLPRPAFGEAPMPMPVGRRDFNGAYDPVGERGFADGGAPYMAPMSDMTTPRDLWRQMDDARLAMVPPIASMMEASGLPATTGVRESDMVDDRRSQGAYQTRGYQVVSPQQLQQMQRWQNNPHSRRPYMPVPQSGYMPGMQELLPQRAHGGPVVAGPILGSDGGRDDAREVSVKSGSFVIPSDIVSGIPGAGGNTLAGMRILEQQFGKPAPHAMASGGPATDVPIKISSGEFVVTPDQVTKLGGGSLERGHRILEQFIKQARAANQKHLAKLPPPARD